MTAPTRTSNPPIPRRAGTLSGNSWKRPGLPDQRLPLRVPQAVGGDDLLRADEIAVVGRRPALRQGAKPLAADLQAVVHDHVRLEGADHLHQRRPPPRFTPQLTVGEVKPQQVQLAVVGAKLPDLVVEVVQIAVEIGDNYFKPAPMLVKKLVECVSKGGNLLLNVGPDAQGRIPGESLRILQK